MPKQKDTNKLSDKEQWKRFKQAAKKADVNEKEAQQTFQKLSASLKKN